MTDRVEVAEDSERARERPADKERQVFLLKVKALLVLNHYHQCEHKRNEISEKALFRRRQVPRQSDKHIHQGKAERRNDY